MTDEARRGFTLIEILVAVTIVAILTVIGVVSYASLNKRSRDTKRKSDLEQMRAALELFRSDKGYYPAVNTTGLAGASSLNTGNSTTGLVSTYIPAIPTDPSTYGYYYYATNLSGSNYYGYCICGFLETATTTKNDCAATVPSPPAGCNYLLKNP